MRWFISRWIFWYVIVAVVFVVFFREEPFMAKLAGISYKRRIERTIVDKMSSNRDPSAYDLTWGIEYYKDLVRVAGPVDYAYGNQGFCYYYLGDSTQALRMYDEAIRLNPEQYSYYWDKGMIYAQKKDAAKAILFLEKAIDVGPTTTSAYLRMSQNAEFRKAVGEQTTFRNLFIVLAKAKEDRYLAYLKLAEIFSLSDSTEAEQLMREEAQTTLLEREGTSMSLQELYQRGILDRKDQENPQLHFNTSCFLTSFMEVSVASKIQKSRTDE